ncbi:hypothetical protein [Pengzhenrongella frigida]|uniref:DUF4386 family protein n=1 Tax=Pengzhenrongella frigida TaxID=1259133 RepID=A0A4Q5MYM1_9MICO|nr:hypothetical protein [Cellulomonas sp. HLT2-17]RYV50902.1 hypothetical protein EUA98_10960 [Cellulomonas sp. HLT2-17]
MTGPAPLPAATARRWRTRRSAAVAGIVFAVLLIVALVAMRVALSAGDVRAVGTDPQRQALIRLSLNIVPFAGIAFLWFIGVVRDQLGAVEDRLFSTVFLGSGLLFLAMLFEGAVVATSLMEMAAGQGLDAGIWAFGRGTTQALITVYAMRMAAVFTLSVSTVALRTSAMPRWVAFVGVAVAVVLLVSAGERTWSQFVFPAWVLLVSVVILFTRPHGPGVAPADEAGATMRP